MNLIGYWINLKNDKRSLFLFDKTSALVNKADFFYYKCIDSEGQIEQLTSSYVTFAFINRVEEKYTQRLNRSTIRLLWAH